MNIYLLSEDIAYILFSGWALIDNDYSKLRRIGMNEYRKKI